MTINDTTRLGMPLLQPSQAQKHVTVNEALMRLDGMVNLVLESIAQKQPGEVVDGQCWGVPSGATGDWAGRDGQIAIGSNGGWIFAPALRGMRAFVADLGAQAIFSGSEWAVGAITLGKWGSGLQAGMLERDFTVSPEVSIETDMIIPGQVMVIGVALRILNSLSGSVTRWRLGTKGAESRFGSGINYARHTTSRYLLPTPHFYSSPEPLVITAENGSFSGGKIRFAVHWLELRAPAGVV